MMGLAFGKCDSGKFLQPKSRAGEKEIPYFLRFFFGQTAPSCH
jgi:hypothetical protein